MDASAGGGENCGDTVAKHGGEAKPMKKVARGIAGMEGGAGEFSYTRNSRMQSQSIEILKPILEREIHELEVLKNGKQGSTFRMADFGCSVGANTQRYAEICYRSLCQARSSDGKKNSSVEVQYSFCDLPSNDFNTLFRQLEDWRTRLAGKEEFFVAAVPGSFYERLFPRASLHVAISVLAVQWMSQVPAAVVDTSSSAYNKGQVWIDGNKNSAAVEAFAQAARQDLQNFVLARAEEVAPGGLVLFYTLGRADERHAEVQWAREAEHAGPYSKVFEATWQDLVTQGLIEDKIRDSFNVPVYCHSMEEVRIVVTATNSFHIKQLEIKQQSYFYPNEVEQILVDPIAYGQFTKNFTRSLLNSYIVEHIGEERSHKFFECLEENATSAAREKKISRLPLDCVLVVLVQK